MTAEPTWPGEGPGENQPGTFTLVGASTVPLAFRPSWVSHTASPMAGIRTAVGTLRATTAGGGTVGVVTTCACEVAARAEDTGRCGTGPAKGWRCSWSPATKHTAPTKRSNAVSTSNDLAMCSVAQWRVRPMLRPRDYESWFWRDGTLEARRRRMASTIVSPAAVNATPPAYTRA